MQEIIKPTIGRKILYLPSPRELAHEMVQFTEAGKPPQPFDANIVYVWSDTCVNLLVTDHAGNVYRRSSVSVNAGGGVLPRAEWMDYQKGQAAKTEALQAELDKKAGAS